MSHLIPFWAAHLLLALSLLLPADVWAGSVVLRLRQEVMLSGPKVRLADLAEIETAEAALGRTLAALPMGAAPMAGQLERRSRGELESLIRRQPPSVGLHIAWQGAASVALRSASRTVSATQLTALASQHLRDRYGAAYTALEIVPAASQADVLVPAAGQLALRVRAAPDGPLRPHMALWIDLLIDGALYRSSVVGLNVAAQRRVLLARRDLRAGEPLRALDFAAAEQDLAGLPPEPAAEADVAGTVRLLKPLAQGQALARPMLARADMVLRGDRLRLLAGGAGVQVETVALALADAAAGQKVQVRLEQGGETLAARVVAAGVVTVDGL